MPVERRATELTQAFGCSRRVGLVIRYSHYATFANGRSHGNLAPVSPMAGAFSLLALYIEAAQTQRVRQSLREGSMVRKICIFAAVGAALFISPAAFAGHGHGHGHKGHGHGHHNHGHGHGHRYHGHVKNNWDDRIRG